MKLKKQIKYIGGFFTMKTMKKYANVMFAAVLALVMTFSMSACGSNGDVTAEAEKTVKSAMDALQNADFNKLATYTASDNTLSELSDEQKIGIEVLTPILNKMSYEIESSEKQDDKNVKVKVKINAVDGESIIKSVMQKIMTEAMTNPSLTEDEDAIQEKMMDLLKQETESTSGTVSNTIEFNVTKQGKDWEIADVDDEDKLINAISGNMVEAISNMGL